MQTPRIPLVVLATALVTAACLISIPATATPATVSQAGSKAACGQFFDDFSYSSNADPRLAANGWSIRNDQGGPGPKGAFWRADNISFPVVDGNKSLQLRLTTDGTAAGTTQAEISQSERRFREGTYLARIKFHDTPASGADGDRLVQTFYSITPLAGDRDPLYSELDYAEYLPNGGWGSDVPLNTQTSWYTTGDNEGDKDAAETGQARSMDGWHYIMATATDGRIRYFVDGQLVAEHPEHYFPRQDMSIDFNQWIVDLTHHVGSGTSVYHEQVDYVYHVKNKALTLPQARARIGLLRTLGVQHLDTVGACPGTSSES